MKNSDKLSLIEGTFSPNEAQEILMNIFFTKINFHEMKNFSAQERIGKKDEYALGRILTLRNNINKFLEVINVAKEKQKKISITSEINIKVTED